MRKKSDAISNADLGLYVKKRPRANGTFNVVFEVPAKNRPSDWPPSIPLPLQDRRGNLGDPTEVKRIQRDAADLHRQMRGETALQVRKFAHGSIPHLLTIWGGRRLLAAVERQIDVREMATDPGDDGLEEGWLDIAPRTRKFYAVEARPILAWSAIQKPPHPHVRVFDPRSVREFLATFKSTKSRQRSIRATLSVIMGIAVEEGIIAANPVESLRRARRRTRGVAATPKRKRPVQVWTADDVAFYAKIARETPVFRRGRGGLEHSGVTWAGGAVLVQLLWQCACDMMDAVTWTRRANFRDGPQAAIEYDRGKTGVPARTPISAELAAEIKAMGSLYLVTAPDGSVYRPVLDDALLWADLHTLRTAAVKAGARKLVFDQLRHSALSDAFSKGVALDRLPALSAHTNEEMARNVYLQRAESETIAIQRARGLIP